MNRIERLIEVARKEQRVVVGLSSGTSVDAIDAVIVRIGGHAPGAEIEKIRFDSFPFPDDIRRRINTLFDRNKAKIDEICHLDFVVGELFAAAAKSSPTTKSRWQISSMRALFRSKSVLMRRRMGSGKGKLSKRIFSISAPGA